MLSAPAPTPPPPPPPVRTDTRPVEPDEQWKADLRRRIEHSLRHMVEDAQTVRDTILSSQPSESSRERAQREYEESMNAIRMLAQEGFNRELRIEMSERRWALDVVDSNSPDVARQQQWILDSIRKADDDRPPFGNPDAPQSAEGVLSTSPQEQGNSERASDESPEGGYGSASPEDEGSGSDQSMESEEGDEEDDGEEEEEGEGEGEGDVQPRLSRPPSRPSVSLTHPIHSRSPVSRRDAQSQQRRPSNFRSAEGYDDEDAGDSPALAHPARPREGQPYSPGGPPRRQSSGSQASVWSRATRPPEPSGISRTFAHANGQMYSPSPVQFPRRGSVNSTGSNSSGAGLHRAGSLNSDQLRGGSAASHNPHNGTERPPTQARDRIASNIGARERQMSASASPHDRPSPPTYPTVAPRAIPGARPPPLDDASRFPTSASPSSRALFSMQRSPEDARQGIAIPRGPTTPEEGPRGTSWSSLQSRRSYGEFNVHRRHNSKGDPRLPPVDGDLSDVSDDVVGQLDDRQSVRSQRSVRSMRSMELEQMALYWEAEARRKEEEANRKEEEAGKKEDEARRLEEKARLSLEEAKRLEAGARQAEASAMMREAAAQKKEAEAKLKEAEAQKREAEAQKREAEARRKEELARHREHEARRKEEQARWKEEEAQRKEEEARKREEEIRRKEDDARKREDDARKREEDAREREKLARQKEEDTRRFEEEVRKKEEDARRKEDEARRKKEEAKQIEQDYERKKREIEQREAELKIWEAELFRKEQAARLAHDELETRRPADEETPRLESEATSPIDAEEAAPEAEDVAKADASSHTPEDPARQALDAESTAPEPEKQTRTKGRKGSKAQGRRQKEKALEEQRQKEQEHQRLEEQRHKEQEQQRLDEQRLQEEKRLEEERFQREREEQIRLDEEISRQEQARLNREAVLEQERLQREAQESEANRIREEQMRAAEEARYRQLEEQRRKVVEQGRQRDETRHQHQHQQEDITRQRVKEEQQKEFERREAQYYQRTVERERQNSMGASFDAWTAHRTGVAAATTGAAGDRSSASSTFSSSAGSTWSSSRPSSMNSSHTSNSSFSSPSVPLSSTPRPSPTSARPGAPGTSPYASKLDEAEWARRAEERARQQQEQFKREQERMESERHAKSAKVLSRDELIRLYENHENKWRQLKDSDNLGWNSFAWPVFKRPFEPEEMTTSAISAYVQSKYAPGADKSPKDRIKDHLKRWHPDKFETRILPRVVEDEREKVKLGAGVVVRGLNELLNKNYDE